MRAPLLVRVCTAGLAFPGITSAPRASHALVVQSGQLCALDWSLRPATCTWTFVSGTQSGAHGCWGAGRALAGVLGSFRSMGASELRRFCFAAIQSAPPLGTRPRHPHVQVVQVRGGSADQCWRVGASAWHLDFRFT